MHTRPGEHLYLCLVGLPREIREMIYAAMLEDLPATIVVRPKASTSYRSSDLPRVVQPICYVYRQLFADSVPELLRTRDIHLDHSGLRTFGNFLGHIPNNSAFLAVKSLTFGDDATWSSGRNDYDGEEEAYSGSVRDGIQLVARCTALQHITLEVDVLSLITTDDDYEAGSESDLTYPGPIYTRKPDQVIQNSTLLAFSVAT